MALQPEQGLVAGNEKLSLASFGEQCFLGNPRVRPSQSGTVMACLLPRSLSAFRPYTMVVTTRLTPCGIGLDTPLPLPTPVAAPRCSWPNPMTLAMRKLKLYWSGLRP